MEVEQIGAAEGEKRVWALWVLRREERERKLRSQVVGLESMMEAEQLGAADGGKHVWFPRVLRREGRERKL